jgi:hypothetical protein
MPSLLCGLRKIFQRLSLPVLFCFPSEKFSLLSCSPVFQGCLANRYMEIKRDSRCDTPE